MSTYGTNEDFYHSEVSYAKKKFYPEARYLPSEENLFCGEYARFKTGNACLQFVELIKKIGEIELAQKVTELRCYNFRVAESKLHPKSYSTEQELFQEILDMHLTALRMKLD
jgi:hypothetical protein